VLNYENGQEEAINILLLLVLLIMPQAATHNTYMHHSKIQDSQTFKYMNTYI